MTKPKIIAFYLPQYHPMPENNEWWGPGFTEWTNVAKARPLFKGHKQPKLPADLGFYDLRLSETREDQAKMAKEAGIYGFCYWHYWFNGKKLMNRPFDEVVTSGKPSFPFCLAWANHSWEKKIWTTNNQVVIGKSETLITQTYGGINDYYNHFYTLLDAFKDSRYIQIKGKLLFMIYDALNFNDFKNFSDTWNNLAHKEGIPEFYFVTHACTQLQIENIDKFIRQGYDAVNVSLHRMPFRSERINKKNFLEKFYLKILHHFRVRPEIVEYSEAIKWLDSPIFENKHIIPTIIPNWDHTPRSGRFGRVFKNCSPELFKKHVNSIIRRLTNRASEDQIIFLKSWNEWGEGNYIEPDMEYGRTYLESLNEVLNNLE